MADASQKAARGGGSWKKKKRNSCKVLSQGKERTTGLERGNSSIDEKGGGGQWGKKTMGSKKGKQYRVGIQGGTCDILPGGNKSATFLGVPGGQ